MKRLPIKIQNAAAILALAIGIGASEIPTQAQGTPKIQFTQTVYDFGKTAQVSTASGVFKFKNVGDGVLKVEPPKPACGCTVAELKKDTLQPGETAELPFTVDFGQVRAQFDKQIAVKSNDPLTPEVALTIKADYTPLYEINPTTLAPKLAFGVNDAAHFTTLTRTDGKPLRQVRLVSSKPWIKATMEPAAKAGDPAARIRVAIQRDGSPRSFNEYVHVYTGEETNRPVSSIYIYGQVMGEVSTTPEALYWSITDSAKTAETRPEAEVTQRVSIRAAGGKPIVLKNPQSTVKGIKVELVAKEAGKVYELIARLDEVPATTVSGNVSFETSVASQPRIELPIIVNVARK